MNNYHVALLNPCKECEEKQAYYTNLITKLWEELRSCHHGENTGSDFSCNHECNYIGIPITFCNPPKLFFQLIVPNKLINIEDNKKQTEESVTHFYGKETWIKLSEDTNHDVRLRTLLARLDEIKTVEGNWSENIAEQLHHIADQLPYSGYILNINWLVCGHSDCVNISNNIPLYGALKRFHTWNNACITLVFNSEDFCNTNFYESWSEELDISLLNFQHQEPFTNTNIVWDGSLTSLEDQLTTNKNLDFSSDWHLSRTSNSGSLQISTNLNRISESENEIEISESKEDMLTDSITIICELSRSNIELWRILPSRFILYHKTLLKRVFEVEKSTYPELNVGSTETVLLASLESCHGTSKKKKKTTEDWMEFVHSGLDNPGFVKYSSGVRDNRSKSQDTGTGTDDIIEMFYLLMYPLEPGIFNVYFLRPEKSFCNLHSALSVYGACFSLGKPTQKVIDELRKVVNSLPWISMELFAKWRKEFDEAYFLSFAKGLSNVKDKIKTEGKPEVSTLELWDIILTSYSETTNISSFSSNTTINEEQSLGSNCSPFCIPEHSLPFDQETWPERQWLKWLDTTCVPASPFKNQFSLAVHLDASEMLKHFTKDGKPLKKELESLRKQIEEKRKNSPAKQEDIEKRRELAVGIEYCTDSVPSSIHSFSPKLLPKHVKHETLSICNTPKTLAKAKLQGVKRNAVPEPPIKKNTVETTELDTQPSTSEQVEPPDTKEKSTLGKSRVLNKKTSKQQRNRKPKKQTKQDDTETKKVSSPEDTKVQTKKRRSFDASEASLPPDSNANTKEKRSDRHKRRLAHVVKRSLMKYGVEPTEDYFDTCSERLYYLCKSFLKDLTTSEGLNDEMKRLAESNVANVVEFEKRRQATKLAENQS